MNIIHLLSQNHLTGAEVYAVSLANEQIKNKHQVYQISNGFYFDTKAVRFELPVETRSNIQFIKNVLWLRSYIRSQNIHIIHSHSRAAAKLAFYATLKTNTAHISSVHGKQHSSISKKLFSKYGQFIIAVCKNVKEHLIRDYSYNENRIKIIPNPVSPVLYKFTETNAIEIKKIAIIGRATGPKAERTEQILNILFSEKFKNLNLQVSIVGAHINQLKVSEEIKSKLKEIQAPQLNSAIYSQFDLVIGSGRVCMESLITGIPTIAFGEALYFGPVTSENFNKALESNFGDIHPDFERPSLSESDTTNDILNLINSYKNQQELKKISQLASEAFSLSQITSKILRLYESAYFIKNYPHWIPVLMYHKIPKLTPNSKHKIYVTEANFKKHINTFKKLGFTGLTFSELAMYRKGLISFKSFPKKPLILTFDDGYRDNLENASPILKSAGYKAQLFLLADSDVNSNVWDHSSDEPPHEIISGEERQKWKTSAFEVGSHGFSHKKITEFTPAEAQSELSDSKLKLEAEFKTSVNVYAFTYGTTSDISRDIAEKAGYDYAVNTDTGGLTIEEDPYAIFRVNIFPDENYWSLFKKTSRWYRRYYFKKRGH